MSLWSRAKRGSSQMWNRSKNKVNQMWNRTAKGVRKGSQLAGKVLQQVDKGIGLIDKYSGGGATTLLDNVTGGGGSKVLQQANDLARDGSNTSGVDVKRKIQRAVRA